MTPHPPARPPLHPQQPPLPQQRAARDDDLLSLLRTSDHPVIHSFPHGAVIVFDHDLRYLSAGGRGLADVGLSRAALEGKTVHEAFPAETAAVLEPLYRAALAGESTTVDVSYAGRTFCQRLAPVVNDDGAVLAGMGFTQDVTDVRQAERQLRESTQRFRLGFEHAPIGMAIVGLDGLFSEVNPALCRLTGYPSAELMELTFQDITHPDDLDADLSLLASLLVGEIDSYALEKRYVTAGGGLVWVLLTVSLVLSDDGEPCYYVSQMQDITERKLRELELGRAAARQSATLEHAANHDDLTGLANRRLVEHRLSGLRDAPGGRGSDGDLAVLFCDLDGFKAVNDEHGHEGGDALLREVARRFTDCARADDTVGRLGGDEFVVLIATQPGQDVRGLTAAIAERICRVMRTPVQIAGGSVTLSVSIGIALPARGVPADRMLGDADSAMYAAKRRGKNSFAFFERAEP